ncbi:SPX DOMAIN-CONTAINING PROTEIN-RELATED [Salix viminalis]|uniref:SPX DOMAIN-CONTAINING PROTEIN-RELATED n=1 Tax=Salix viminalis TaxID=40686 RepID=A0A9Q0NP15_SALVM|nr:SPX DOMAIN-CONTAINING PROTEIN-RELATED [Salix viminalis]
MERQVSLLQRTQEKIETHRTKQQQQQQHNQEQWRLPALEKKPRFAAAEGGGGGDCKEGIMTKEEIDFIKLLEDELEKFNSFFVEKEEEYIIRLKELQDSVAKANNSNEEMIKN